VAWVELTEMAEGGDSQLKNAVRGGDGPVTGVDERPRREGLCSCELLA
jgi:hypothetical protein